MFSLFVIYYLCISKDLMLVCETCQSHLFKERGFQPPNCTQAGGEALAPSTCSVRQEETLATIPPTGDKEAKFQLV